MAIKTLLILAVTLTFVLLTPTAYACSCATGDPPFEFNRAKIVFIGRMIKGTEKFTVKDSSGKSSSLEAGTVRFVVQESFKGDVVGELSVEVASMRGTSCGDYGLRRGVVYLVYGYASEQNPNTFYTGVCTRTNEVNSSYSKKDLDFLRNLPPPGTGGNLRGSIWADLRTGRITPLPNLTVNITGPDSQSLTALTNEGGEFEVKFLKPGKYKVTPQFPENYFSEHDSHEVMVADRGTARVAFEAYINGNVRGRVVDKDGNPFNSAFLRLENKASVYGHSIGEDGAFEVKGVPPGEYYLYIELQGRDYNKEQKYYYPGTLKREEATVINVGLGEKIEGLQFILPEKFIIRTVEGQVKWDDGKPAAGVEVMLLCPQNADPEGFAVEFGPTRVTTDAEGRFRLEAFTGEAYWIEARGSKTGDMDDGFHSPSRKITMSENLRNVSLVLSERGYFGSRCSK